MTVHHIKIDTQYVDAVLTGLKPFEVRRNDRAYQVGDHLIMTEVGEPGEEKHWADTEDKRDCSWCRIRRYIAARISYVYSGDPRFGGHGGLQPGHVVLGLEGVDLSLPMTRVLPPGSGHTPQSLADVANDPRGVSEAPTQPDTFHRTLADALARTQNGATPSRPSLAEALAEWDAEWSPWTCPRCETDHHHGTPADGCPDCGRTEDQ